MMDGAAEISEGIQQIKEYGFREVESTDQALVLDRRDLPWLPDTNEQGEPQPGVIVPLALVTLQGGEQFYCGSAIKGKTLIEEVENLGDKSEQANKLFYSTIQHHIKHEPGVKVLDEAVTQTTDTPHKIFYSSNGRGGIRTYYMQMEEREGKPAFLRIATSKDKGSEIRVLSVLTTNTTKEIRKRCLGK